MKTERFALLLQISLLILLLGIPFTVVAEEDVVLPDLPRISAEELLKLINTKADVVIVDTRDSGSYAAGHIKGAINIYYDVTSDPMQRQMMLIALPMDKMVVTYCDCTDDANSAQVIQELYDLGYELEYLRVLSGGSLRWVDLKYPLVKTQ